MRETFTFKNSIKNTSSNTANEKKYLKKFIQVRKKIIKNLDNLKDTFHVLSKKYEFNLKVKDLKNLRNLKMLL